MLALTPVPLQTAGERALFGELTRWDTGGSVRAAVVASIPLIDGPLGRRISDAILFVPEGVAVIRIAEVLRQSGLVKAVPDGPWTIAPESGPSQVLQLSGGGSSPLDGLMKAGMETAMRLRRAGLEPGRIARLTVLVGDLTGVIPSDGDLGEGDQVAAFEPRSLLLGIARASRYAGVDNPRLWTTADVRAALEAMGLQGRGPSVEELNGEGFPYSPYVLRRPELLTPAAMAASPEATAPVAPAARAAVAPPVAPAPIQPLREQPSPAAIAQAVAASAAAGHAAAAAEEARPPATGRQGDTVAVDGPAEPPDDGGGIGGLFADPEPAAPPEPAEPPRTSVLPAATPPAATPPAATPPAATPPAATPGERFSYWTNQSAPVDDGPDDEERDRASGRRAALWVAAALLVVAVLGVGGWLALRGRDDGGSGGGAAATATQTQVAAGPKVGDVQDVGGVQFTVEAVKVDDTCVGHAYGKTADFFTRSDCTGLSRALYSAEVDGQPVVVSVSRVRLADTAAARSLRGITDSNGTGNVSDLLREGVRYTGSPAELSNAEYASALSGPVVTIVESAWAAENPQQSSAAIDKVADDGLALQVPPFPEG